MAQSIQGQKIKREDTYLILNKAMIHLHLTLSPNLCYISNSPCRQPIKVLILVLIGFYTCERGHQVLDTLSIMFQLNKHVTTSKIIYTKNSDVYQQKCMVSHTLYTSNTILSHSQLPLFVQAPVLYVVICIPRPNF
jgi:hypothetical protein